MNILNKKIFRDIKTNKMQFFNIFVMVFLGVCVFAGIHAYIDGMQTSGDRYYEENNLQDIWITGENFNTTDLDDVKKIANVKDAERILTIKTELSNKKNVTLETNFIETNNISKMYIVEGEEFAKDKKGAWIDSFLAKNLNLHVGDEITCKYKDYEITEKILGLVTTPDHLYSIKDDSEMFPTHQDYGFVYMSINEFPIGEMFNQILVDVEDTAKIEDTKSNIEENIENAIAITDRESNLSYKMYDAEIEKGRIYADIFTSLFLFIAILSVVTTMNRFVKKQRTQIGTLKALGFKKGAIVRHYIAYGFYIALAASVLGVLARKIYTR